MLVKYENQKQGSNLKKTKKGKRKKRCPFLYVHFSPKTRHIKKS